MSTDELSPSKLQETLGEEFDPADLFGADAAAAGIASADKLGGRALDLQEDWMGYIKGLYEPFSDVATQALNKQVQLSGLGGDAAKQQMLAGIEADPLYQAKVKAGEDAVLRGASSTGGLRSGDANSALALQNQALLDREIGLTYQQLAGLSGQGFEGSKALGTFGGQTLDQMSTTLGSMASGQVAAGSAASQRGASLAGGLMGMAGKMFSDERLKTNISVFGTKNGLPMYRWDWNKTAYDKFGLEGQELGHMVSDVELKYPELIGETDGYKTVNYGGLPDAI